LFTDYPFPLVIDLLPNEQKDEYVRHGRAKKEVDPIGHAEKLQKITE
jgi:hypothetical protein